MEQRRGVNLLQFRNWPISLKLLFGIGVIVLLAILVPTYINVTTLQNQLRAEVGADFEALARAQMSHIVDILSEQLTLVRSIAVNDYIRVGVVTGNARYSGEASEIEAHLLALDQQWQAVSRSPVESSQNQLLQAILDPELNPLTFQLIRYAGAFPDNLEIFITDRYGGLLAATQRTSDYYQADETWWQATYNEGHGAFYVSQPGYDESTGKMALMIAAPIMGGDLSNPSFIGVVRTTFDVDVLRNAVQARSGGARTTLVDANGMIIAGPNMVRVGKQVPESWMAWVRSQDAETDSERPRWQEAQDEEGIPILYGYAPITSASIIHENERAPIYGLDWTLFVHRPQKEAYASVTRTRRVGWLAVALFFVLAMGAAFAVARTLVTPLAQLVSVTRRMAFGDLSARAEMKRQDEIGELADNFNHMADEIAEIVATLEQRVESRTSELEQRSHYLEASAEVSRAVSSMLDANALIRQVVDLIRERFDLYYVGLFLVDEENVWAVLRAGTGEPGKSMLARQHRIRIGEGMIGWSVANARPRVALEVGGDAVRLATEELPLTRSEAALPLRSRGQVLGAITVQSEEPGVFDEDTVVVLQAMADQVAVALDNARLLGQRQEALERLSRAYGESIRDAWIDIFGSQLEVGYLSTSEEAVQPVSGPWSPAMLQALQRGETTEETFSHMPARDDSPAVSVEGVPAFESSSVVVPVKIRDQVLGVMEFNKPETAPQWTEEEVVLLETLCEQLGLALERARLYEDSRRRAADESMVSQVAARIRETLNVDTVLQTATREMRDMLNLAEVEIRMGMDSMDGDSSLRPASPPSHVESGDLAEGGDQ